MSLRTRPVSRRTVVGATLAGTLAGPALLAGCTLEAPAADRAPGPSTEPEPDADVLLVGTVLTALDATAALVAAAVDRHPRLEPALAPLAQVHALHRAVLDEAAEVDPDGAATARVPARATPALARVRLAESRLAGTLREATATAQSGDLARALASMAASLGQHLAVLDGGTSPA